VKFAAITAAAVSLVALTSAGCAGISSSDRELSAQPIAFVYHSEELARRRAEAIADRENKPQPRDSRSATENRGVLNLNSFSEYLDSRFGGREQAKYRGRLALLDPESRDFSVLEGLQRGAVPQAWSSDHRRLLFAQGDPGRLQLFEYDLATQEVAAKTHGPDPHPQGCYASGGRLVVTVHRSEVVEGWGPRPHLTSRLGIQSPTGSIDLITSGPIDGDPACSRDGKTVAYSRAFGSGTQIWIQALSAGAPSRPVTPGRDPAFSPDGRWLVFSRDDGDKPTLWRIRIDGVGRTRMGVGAGFDEFRPVVSPDGDRVVYESVHDNRFRLFMRRFDGSGDAVLFASGDGSHAVW
jgi:Tol biopolymer transport system component